MPRADREGATHDWPVEQRLEHRIVDGDRNGLESDLDEALSAGPPGSRHRERLPPRRQEDRG